MQRRLAVLRNRRPSHGLLPAPAPETVKESHHQFKNNHHPYRHKKSKHIAHTRIQRRLAVPPNRRPSHGLLLAPAPERNPQGRTKYSNTPSCYVYTTITHPRKEKGRKQIRHQRTGQELTSVCSHTLRQATKVHDQNEAKSLQQTTQQRRIDIEQSTTSDHCKTHLNIITNTKDQNALPRRLRK